MDKKINIFIDPWTCNKYQVDPEAYRQKIVKSLLLDDKYVTIDHIQKNSARGDYIRTGAISGITTVNVDEVITNGIFDQCCEIFKTLGDLRDQL